MTDSLVRLVSFGRALREEGLPVGTGDVERFCDAAALLDSGDLYWAGRATLVSRADDIAVYDRVFRAFFAGEEDQPAARRAPAARRRAGGRGEVAPLEPGRDAAGPPASLASQVEILKRKRFAACSPDELARLARLMQEVRVAMPSRRSRRRAAARAGSPDLRRTLRRSFRTGGEPLERAWRARRARTRRLVLILDVSGSMASYSRALVTFAHAALRTGSGWQAFCFGTRLTRLTAALATAGADDALRRAAEEVFDWDGGTRIGESLKAFLDGYGHGGIARGAVVVVCSDGLEVGDPELLREQMARLSRLAHRVVWLNPLKEDPAYEPLARGMQAALPYVDVLASGHSLASLESLAGTLARL